MGQTDKQDLRWESDCFSINHVYFYSSFFSIMLDAKIMHLFDKEWKSDGVERGGEVASPRKLDTNTFTDDWRCVGGVKTTNRRRESQTILGIKR